MPNFGLEASASTVATTFTSRADGNQDGNPAVLRPTDATDGQLGNATSSLHEKFHQNMGNLLRDGSLFGLQAGEEQRWLQQHLPADSQQRFYGILPFHSQLLQFESVGGGSRVNGGAVSCESALLQRNDGESGSGPEDYDCSVEDSSCSDISLTMSLEDSQNEQDKRHGGK